jgi:hypothetical protein
MINSGVCLVWGRRILASSKNPWLVFSEIISWGLNNNIRESFAMKKKKSRLMEHRVKEKGSLRILEYFATLIVD